MEKFSFALPETNLIFGKGILSDIGKLAREHGSRALLVTGMGSMRKLSFLQKAETTLEEAGLSVELFEGVEPNPTVATVQSGIENGIKSKCDLVVAIGGGSAIDAAKAMAVGIGHRDANIWPYVRCRRPTTAATLPIIAIPSTSGTGSHVTWYTVITNQETSEKAAYSSKFIYPKVSIVDLDIVSKMPAKVTAETGFDALSHLMESYISSKASPITDVLALSGLKLVAMNLPRAYRDGSDMDARYNMALADTYAGICITASRTVMPHGMGNVVSGIYPHISHGMALASLMPHVMRFNIENGDERTIIRHCHIAKALGADISKIDRYNALKVVNAVRSMTKEVGLDKSLSEYGVTEESIGQMADYAITLGAGALGCNPVKVTKKDIIRVYKEAL